MKRLLSRVTPLGWLLLVATVVVAVALVVTNWKPLAIVLVVVCLGWIWVYKTSDPIQRWSRGEDVRSESERWRDANL